MCMWFCVSFGSFTELRKTSRGACFELQHFKEEDYFYRVRLNFCWNSTKSKKTKHEKMQNINGANRSNQILFIKNWWKGK